MHRDCKSRCYKTILRSPFRLEGWSTYTLYTLGLRQSICCYSLFFTICVVYVQFWNQKEPRHLTTSGTTPPVWDAKIAYMLTLFLSKNVNVHKCLSMWQSLAVDTPPLAFLGDVCLSADCGLVDQKWGNDYWRTIGTVSSFPALPLSFLSSPPFLSWPFLPLFYPTP